MMFLSLLTPRNLLIAAFAFLIAAIGVQNWRIGHLQHQLATERAQSIAALKTCHEGQVAALDAIRRANAFVEAQKTDSDRRAKMLSDGLQQARKAAAAADKRSLDILAVKPRGADQCARLMDLDRQINGGR